MSTYLAFLRGINIGGHGVITMADLRTWFARQEFTDVQSILQSGNFLLHGPRRAAGARERELEAAAEKQLGLKTTMFIRTPAEWQEVIAQNPFPAEAQRDPSHLVLFIMKAAVVPAQIDAVQASIRGREVVRGSGRHIYAYYPDAIGQSLLTLPVIEKGLSGRGTGRSWGTVLKMAALAADRS